jgi:hypothetical protein
MSMRYEIILSSAAALVLMTAAVPASALTMHECSEKYKAAKDGGTLKAKSWNDFRKAECGGSNAATEHKAPQNTTQNITTKRTSEMKQTAAKDMAPEAAAGGKSHGLSMKECGKKYRAAKAGGSLGSTTWNDFRKTECGVDAAALSETITQGAAVFPKAIARKYAKDSAGKARRMTCLDQYKANKVADENGGLKWIQKGGGYYSQCNKILSQQVGSAQ